MTRAAVVLALLGVSLAGCSGGDPETFARDANASCREYRVAFEDAPEGVGPDFWPRALQTHIEQLKDLDAPSEDGDRYDEMLAHHEESLAAVEVWAEQAKKEDWEAVSEANERWRVSAVKAAQIAGDLGLQDCDRALS